MKVQPEATPATAQPAGPNKSFADALRVASTRPGVRAAKPVAGMPAKPVAEKPAAGGSKPTKPGADDPTTGSSKPTKPDAVDPTAGGSKPARPLSDKSNTVGSQPANPAARAANAKGAAAARMKLRGAAQILQSVTESGARTLRQVDASRATDKVHALAHADSAQISACRQSERVEDLVRVGLFQAIERECAKAPSPMPDREPESRPAQQPTEQVQRSEAVAAAAAQPSAPTASTSSQRAEAVAALVERIDAALKQGLPTMSLGLADRSGASSIEITRTGKGEVAVRIAARSDRRAHLEASSDELKAALASRGLRLKSLSIG